MWAISLYWAFKRQAVFIHNVVFYLITIKLGIDAAYLMRILICNPLSDSVLLTMLKAAGATIFQAFTSALICVLSLGISITNDTFTKKQFLKVMIATLYSYLSYSTYNIFGSSNRVILFISRIFISSFCIYMLFTCLPLCYENVKGLWAEARRINTEELNDIRKGLIRKVWIYSIFGVVISVYYVSTIVEHIGLLTVEVTNKTQYWFEGIEAIACWAVYFTIMCLFHPCLFNASFRLGQIISREVIAL